MALQRNAKPNFPFSQAGRKTVFFQHVRFVTKCRISQNDLLNELKYDVVDVLWGRVTAFIL